MKEGSGVKDYHRGIESDLWLRMFFSGLITRESCDQCPYREDHVSDFTIWDCFAIKEYVPEFDDDKGTTRMRINTNKGMEIFQQIKKHTDGRVCQRVLLKLRELMRKRKICKLKNPFIKICMSKNQNTFLIDICPTL